MDLKKIADQHQLTFHLDKKFGSQTENYRQNIRRHIVQNYPLTETEKAEVLNLDKLPVSEKYYFSIAHTVDLGGYVASPKPVGFDLEKPSRLTPEAVKRVSTEAEWKLFDDLRFLWVTKESLVKLFTLDRSHPPLMSDFKITRSLQNKFETPEAMGYVGSQDDHFFAVAFKRGQATFL